MAYFAAACVLPTRWVSSQPFSWPGSVERVESGGHVHSILRSHGGRSYEEMWVLADDQASFGAADQTEVLFAYKDFDYQSRPAEILDAVQNAKSHTQMLLRRRHWGSTL